jgi:hypothetical protein
LNILYSPSESAQKEERVHQRPAAASGSSQQQQRERREFKRLHSYQSGVQVGLKVTGTER